MHLVIDFHGPNIVVNVYFRLVLLLFGRKVGGFWARIFSWNELDNVSVDD